MSQRTLSLRQAALKDVTAIQALADAQTARFHAGDARLPARHTLPPWMILADDGPCWLAEGPAGVIGALCAERESWAAASPLANVFPRRYLRVRLWLADDADPGELLPALLARLDAWPGTLRIPARMLLAPVCDARLMAALRGCGFSPYHTIAHRPMTLPLPGLPEPVDGLLIRTAAEWDVPVVAELMAESWRFHAAHQPAIELSDSLLEGCMIQTRQLLGGGMRQVLLLAERGDEVVGFFGIGLSVQDPTARPALFCKGRYGDIFEVAVRADQRGRGIGRALFRAAWQWFRRRNVVGVFVNYAPTNPLSSRFWPKLGFRDAWVNWWRP